MMTSPRIDNLLENVDSNYASVLVAAKRARQINSYYHNLGEGAFEEFPPPMIETASKNYLTIALEEDQVPLSVVAFSRKRAPSACAPAIVCRRKSPWPESCSG
jgi:DNA-directed RNA polymerase subunit omega